MLVVSDEGSVWIGGQSCLSSPGQTEEDSDISVLTLIGRGVESENVVLDWHFVEEDSENSLLQVSMILESDIRSKQQLTFFISPAYSVPRMTISLSAKLMATDVPLVIPSVYLLAGKEPAL